MSMQGFRATHVVPPGGLSTRPQPDPALPPGQVLGGGLEVNVDNEWGAWAHVVCSNGWSAWVDGRTLIPRSAPASGAWSSPSSRPEALERSSSKPSPSAQLSRAPVAVAGAVLIAAAGLLPWVRGGGSSSNAFKVPLKSLFVLNSGSGGPKIGWLLLVMAVGAVALVAFSPDDIVRRVVGGATVVVAALFVIQIQRALMHLDSGPSLISTLGVGVLGCVIGGAMVALAPEVTKRSP
ncbi:MAG: hypothetical protein QOJ19_17 [Acidimicrobiia bacterium]|nr:hypothetical protein [Acidimicrobiia bacterium]